jgi:tRNA A-37 threonylcarbamoyl transferase component Bud32
MSAPPPRRGADADGAGEGGHGDGRAAIKRLGRYEIIRPVGRGGMAEVFLARSIGPGGVEKRVCVKRVLPALAGDPRAARRFADEARAALSLQHANIVPVFDFGREGQDLFLVMEWIDGCDLAQLLAAARAQGQTLSPITAAYVGAEIARALAYAHERTPDGHPAGLVHRDVTPRNVLLSRSGEVRLTDFGNARVLGAAGAPSGTPRYMAPEQARGEPPRPADDLYALGLVLAELLTGRPRRDDNTIEAALRPVAVPDLPGCPAPLARVVADLLAPSAGERPARAAEVQEALSRLLADAVLRGQPSPNGEIARALAAMLPATAVPGAAAAGVSSMPGTAAAETVDADARAGAGTTSAGRPGEGAADRGTHAARRRRSPIAIATLAIGAAAVAGAALLTSRAPTSRARGPSTADIAPPVRVAPALPPAPTVATPARPATQAAAAPAPRAPATVAPAAPPRPGAERHRRGTAEVRILAPGSWVAVYLDGHLLGNDAGAFPIAPGRHQLRVQNPPLGFVHTEVINVREGETLTRSYHPASAGAAADEGAHQPP